MRKKLLSMMLAILLFAGIASVSVPAYATGANVAVASAAVEIVSQPKSAVVSYGATAKATVKASGEGLSYQWYYKDTAMKSFGKSSIKTDTYTVAVKGARDGRQIYCEVTDKYGNSVKSNTVTLKTRATILVQPKSVIVARGKEAKVTVEAAGKDLTYQWYYKNKGGLSFRKTDTFDGNTYTAEMTSGRNGRQVYCKITDAYGNTVKTNTVTIGISLLLHTRAMK